MTEQGLVYGVDFTVEQFRLKRGFNYHDAKGKHGRGRPKGSRNKNGYHRRLVE